MSFPWFPDAIDGDGEDHSPSDETVDEVKSGKEVFICS